MLEIQRYVMAVFGALHAADLGHDPDRKPSGRNAPPRGVIDGKDRAERFGQKAKAPPWAGL